MELGKIASLVSIKCSKKNEASVQSLANKIAVHIVGYDPHFLSKDEVYPHFYVISLVLYYTILIML